MDEMNFIGEEYGTIFVTYMRYMRSIFESEISFEFIWIESIVEWAS